LPEQRTDQNRIDVVILWVDGSDPAWQAEKARISAAPLADGRDIRYRDWGLLPYLFRGLERFAPWIDTVHFVTWGHLPPWLNLSCPKLHIVKHTDFIPAQYLPTFSSNTIELNIHRIEGLADQFIYFNDDMFLLRPVSADAFFRNGLPRDYAIMNPAHTLDLTEGNGDERIFYMPYNDTNNLNVRYSMRACVKQHPLKWFHPSYGANLLRNMLLLPWNRFVGFVDRHLPQPYIRSSFSEAWADEFDVLDATCRNQIRTDHDVNHWYIRYRQLAEGNFIPMRPLKDGVFSLKPDNAALYDCLENQRLPMVCLNDSPLVGDRFPEEQARIQRAFDRILPEKSGYER
jgi:hypothetical protein